MVSKIKHIVLADDDEDDSMLFKEAFAAVSSEIKVSLAGDGQKLLHFIQLSTPDLIFLDLNMPRKNGLECLKEIRSINKFDHVPIIIYSTSESRKDIDTCYTEGASFYLVKPYSFKAIINMINVLLNQRLNNSNLETRKEVFVLKM